MSFSETLSVSSSLDLETKNSQGKFEDFDLLERGGAQEFKKDDFALKPAPTKHAWTRCYVVTDRDTKSISMYRDTDDNDFLFTAFQHKGSFFISQYKSFPKSFRKMKEEHARRSSTVHQLTESLTESVLSVARRSLSSDTATDENSDTLGQAETKALIENQTKGVTRYHAKLIANSTSSFTLYSTRCEHCDKLLRRFTCGGVLAPHNECRQRLADINHSLVPIAGVDGVEARRLEVIMPGLLDEDVQKEKGVFRVPWCPRVKKEFTELVVPVSARSKSAASESETLARTESEDVGREEKGQKQKQQQLGEIKRCVSDGATVKLSSSASFSSFASSMTPNIACASRLPEWNEDAGSLVLTFQDGRVKEPSAKNFLLADIGSKTTYHIQFGKVKNGKYNLDFKHPVSPLQAFGVALSAFAWKLENKSS
eukprot:g2412.t1